MEQSNSDDRQLVIVRAHVTNLTLLPPQDILSAYRNGYVLNYIACGGITQRHKLGKESLDLETLSRLVQFAKDYDSGNLNFYEYTAFLDQLKAKGVLCEGGIV